MYTTSDSEERTGPFHSSELEEGKWYDKHLPMANPNKEESMEEEEDTGVQEMWENGFIAVANGEWMNKQQFNSAIQDYPDLMFNRNIPIQFGRMANQMKTQPAHTQIQRAVSGLSRPKPPAHARADRSSEPQLASSIQPESTGIPKPQETQETKDPLNDVEPPAKIYPESLAHVTPHPSRKLSRMPSTTTTIGAALGIPSLAKASLEEMKDMHSIWSRTRDHLCKSMEELRIGGHHIKTPSAYDNLASHNSLVDIFCRRLQGRIQDAGKSGISKEIEVVDLIDLTGDDNDYPNSCLGERRLKRASRLSDIEDEDESPVQTKRARKSSQQIILSEFTSNDGPPKIITSKPPQDNNQSEAASHPKTTEITVLYQNPRPETRPEPPRPMTRSSTRSQNTKSSKDVQPPKEKSISTKEPSALPNEPSPLPNEPSTESKEATSTKGKKKAGGRKNKKQEETPEARKQNQEERKRKREEKKKSPYNDPPQPGTLLTKIRKKSESVRMHNLYSTMLEMSRNPQWDYGPELMELVADMVQWSAGDTECDEFYEMPELFTPSVEAIQALGVAHDPDFRHCISSNPRLLQLGARDPFFKREVFNIETVKQAATTNGSFKCASWKSLYSMMIRVDDQDDFTEDPETCRGFQSAIRKLHSLAKSCTDNLHLYLNPNPVSKEDFIHWKQDTLFEAGRFVIGQIKTIQAGAASTLNTNGNGRTANRLLVLQKRIWETLLCCLMMQNSFFIDYLEECIKKKHFPDKSLEAAAKMSEYNRERSLFKEGDVKDLNSTKEMKEWGKIRLSAFGSMAVFFLFGTAGWWHCLTDSHNFNQRDVWSFVHLAHAKHDWLYDKQHINQIGRKDTPWDKTDSFVRWLLKKTNMNCVLPSDVDWEAAPRFWAKHLTEKTISRYVIQDLMAEMCAKKPNKTLNFNGEEAPDVKLHPSFQEKADSLQSKLMGSWPDTIEDHYQKVIEAHEEHEREAARLLEEEEEQREGRDMLLDRASQTPPPGQRQHTNFRSPSGHSAYSLLQKAKQPPKTTTDYSNDKDSDSEAEESNKEDSDEEAGEEKESDDESDEEEEDEESRVSQVPPVPPTKTGKSGSSDGSSSLSEPPSEEEPESSGTDPRRDPSE
ncbi:uncharacterized protein PGTG_10689 [Puccinia graminis f. sp. tritici CRL 75-36-700-3]|uniref:Golgi to ER traffic-protein n=1 Tax=Puccinia graminis f. sp. tritici (strain CRL 75-36-700-3 / race SCCL) TaxID=418459 RepID=E3KJQ5_PUCGT|nr:uncharacterized protein PGTG_10689 [Puccinia graminis f. sp. tritici CRL 75-36-700-3]EFP84530.2 hypothetical protein PGTG_10689 [Puccinia graminis f. sp. tritici CRL 75-36-700-3]